MGECMSDEINLYDVFSRFMSNYDLYPKPVPGHPGYSVDPFGNVFKPDNTITKQFNSCGYKQVRMINADGDRSIKGVHQVVAMTFDENYYDGCVVHHIDENKHNNYIENLESISKSEHSRHHANPAALQKYIGENGPANRGKEMPQEFKDKCRQSALNRRTNCQSCGKFTGNQYMNADGSRKEVTDEFKQRFSEACRRGALNRKK